MASIPVDFSSEPQRLSFQAIPDASVMKLTRGHSCVLCQQRKVRCDKNKPCANCVKAQVECKVVPPQPPRRRKKKPHERELVERLKKYESLLAQHGVNFEPIGYDFKVPDSAALDDVDEIEHGMGELKTSPSSTAPDFSSPSQSSHNVKSSKWFPYYKEFRITDDMLRDPSDSDEGPTMHSAFDTMFDNQDGFPFVIGGSTTSVTEFHPSAIQIFQLWQIYLNNVNPLLNITHTPTLQGQIIEAGANLSKISKPLEVLMFSIYFIAITSMPEDEVQSTFDEDKNHLISKYHHATQQALINAGFMRSPDFMVLQAYLMYLLSVRQYVDPRSLFCLIGIAVRMAQRIGLHRDGAQFGLSPFEVELRRRLWWQLVTFDKRIAEMTGSTITAISSSHGDCKWPLNINDTDLHVNAKDPPAPYAGPTELFFSLTRFELTAAAAPDGVRPVPNFRHMVKTRFQYSPSPSSPDIVTHVASQNLPQDLEGYCNYMESTYLKHCDPKIPFQFFTLMMTRQSLSKLRVVDYLCRHQNSEQRMDLALRDIIFEEAIRVVEYDNVVQSAESLRGFIWYTYMHFPFLAYIFLVSELRNVTTGELCERAWQAISENYDRRNLARNLRSPMLLALGGMMMKVWDAHESAELELGRTITPPKIITVLRELVGKSKKRSPAKGGPAGEPPASAPYTKAPFEAAPSAGQGMSSSGIDDAFMFPPAGAVNQFFGSVGLQDMDFGQMDWTSIMQGLASGGYGGGFGPGAFDVGAFPPPPGGPHGPVP
ncbi:C6 zinc finger domain-containing protein [Pleurostoma richardsiae]|uniref:C6 zinc finger domain-containing protein n=1 Tax=Pleurostoma richardsiae TaxID=41990 RepID=A0AA38RIQ9_9PEZI|nr:C6 zinc finger domain-containing protein [Pleurostoma richardsiae]